MKAEYQTKEIQGLFLSQVAVSKCFCVTTFDSGKRHLVTVLYTHKSLRFSLTLYTY